MNVHVFELEGRGRILATGEDRKRLLHAMTTNHVRQLETGDGCYAFFLNAQGRIQADVHLLARPDSILLDTTPETREFVYGHLDKYIIADDVTLEDQSAQWTTLAVEGPDAEALLRHVEIPLPGEPFANVEWAGRLVARLSYTGLPGYWILLSPLDAPIVREKLLEAGAGEWTVTEAEAERVRQGHPLYGKDITDAHVVQETNQMHAVHFSKGCYLGQEIVERIRSQGKVHRLLTKLRIAGSDSLAAGAKVFSLAADGSAKEAGYLTSTAPDGDQFAALAYLRREFLELPATLSVDGRSAKVIE